MATIIATESVTLDGVMQAPGRADEDDRGGFRHGGWAGPYSSPEAMAIMGRQMGQSSGMLFGRRTYDDLVGHWLGTPDPNPFTDHLRATPKWVASRSDEPLAHPNSTLLTGEAVDTVARLREEVDGQLTVLGSGVLVRTLLAAGLLDALVLLVHPLVLGAGTRLFDAGPHDLVAGPPEATSTGVTITRYEVARADR